MTDPGDKDSSDKGAVSSAPDDFLKAAAATPERTLQSPRREGDADRFAHFKVLGRLGEGGMGIVYRAQDEKLGRVVALKVLPREFEADETRRGRFLREARVAAAVTHPNLTTVYEIGESQGRIFIAMELVEGRPLRALLDERPLPAATVLHLVSQIAAGVARAHAAGIVHRDLKPENILVSNDQHVKVLDFGLAKRASDVLLVTGTGEGMLLGTPAYMPPEQAQGQPVTPATDVFSLGVLLHEMLTSQRPFTGKNLPQLVRSIAQDTPAAPSSVNPLVPAAFDGIVARCLDKEPAGRYPDAQALLEDLRKLAAASSRTALASTVEHPIGDSLMTPAPSTVPRRTRPWRKGLLLLGALVLAGSLGAVAMSGRSKTSGALSAASPTASAAASSAVRAVTEWPPPRTSSPEAATLYAEALQALRDASLNTEATDLERAVALDPHFAAAHLRLALYWWGSEKARRHLAAATQARTSLDPRDQRFLAFAEAINKDLPAAFDVRSPHELAQALPDDPEALYWAAKVLDLGDTAEGESTELFERALQLDPKFAGVEMSRASIAFDFGDVEASLAAADRCLAIAPNAASCLRRRAIVHGARGQCQELERDARQLIAIEPDGPHGYAYLWTALAAGGAAVEALQHLAARQEAAVRDADLARRFAIQDAANLAVWTGDFASAEASLLALQREEASLTDESDHTAEFQLVSVDDEQGAVERAAAVGDDYLRRMPAWNHDGASWGRLAALEALSRAGRVSEPQAHAMREAWRKDWTPLMRGRWVSLFWIYFYHWVATPAEAREALAALPADRPTPPPPIHPYDQGDEGRIYALAGDVDRAIPLLRGEAVWCGDVSGSTSPVSIHWLMDRMHDRLLLGRMLEQKSDRDGACAQYKAILAQWGTAKPRSVTADKAGARSKALGCP